jgi:hypothetical protein
LGLTKATLQQRANQLARELHSLENSDDIIRTLEGFQSKPKKPVSKNSKTKSESKKGGKNGNQTAIHSFFAKTSTKLSASVVELSDVEDVSSKQPEENDPATSSAVHVVEIVEIDPS